MNANPFSQVNLGSFEGPSLRINNLPKWYFLCCMSKFSWSFCHSTPRKAEKLLNKKLFRVLWYPPIILSFTYMKINSDYSGTQIKVWILTYQFDKFYIKCFHNLELPRSVWSTTGILNTKMPEISFWYFRFYFLKKCTFLCDYHLHHFSF